MAPERRGHEGWPEAHLPAHLPAQQALRHLMAQSLWRAVIATAPATAWQHAQQHGLYRLPAAPLPCIELPGPVSQVFRAGPFGLDLHGGRSGNEGCKVLACIAAGH